MLSVRHEDATQDQPVGVSQHSGVLDVRRTTSLRGAIGAAALAGLIVAGPWPAAPGAVVAAPRDPILDVELDVDTVTLGSTVTLTASVFDTDGTTPLAGPGTNTQVRFYFQAGSPNAPGGTGNNPDLSCRTGQAGTCSVTYVPANTGVDVICAKTSTGPGGCSEAIDATERVDELDTVQRTVVAGTPSPGSDPSPTPAPTPTPDPTPTPAPDPTASPTPTPDPTPTPTPVPTSTPQPTAAPTPQPTPQPTAAPTPQPTPQPTATPTPQPTSTPTPQPTATPASPTPTPHPAPTAEPTPTASPAPTDAPSAAPVAEIASPEPTSSPDRQPVTAAVVPVDPQDGDGTTGRGTGLTGGDGVRPPTPGRPSDDLQGAVDAIVGFAVEGAGKVLQPEAAAAVATSFGFPFGLALLVLLFLLVQSRLDDRDPKLRSAPRTMGDTLVAFEDDVR